MKDKDRVVMGEGNMYHQGRLEQEKVLLSMSREKFYSLVEKYTQMIRYIKRGDGRAPSGQIRIGGLEIVGA